MHNQKIQPPLKAVYRISGTAFSYKKLWQIRHFLHGQIAQASQKTKNLSS
jgi:hypothetical protein